MKRAFRLAVVPPSWERQRVVCAGRLSSVSSGRPLTRRQPMTDDGPQRQGGVMRARGSGKQARWAPATVKDPGRLDGH